MHVLHSAQINGFPLAWEIYCRPAPTKSPVSVKLNLAIIITSKRDRDLFLIPPAPEPSHCVRVEVV